MARPRQFDEEAVLDAVLHCFWRHGYEATSVRDLCARTGLTTASLYNAFGDKQALYRLVFDRYVESSIIERIRRLEIRPGREALHAFFGEIVHRSVSDAECKGCFFVNAAIEPRPGEADFREAVSVVLSSLESFFLGRVEAGQAEGTITRSFPAARAAQHLLGTLMGLRVLARARPDEALLRGVAATALLSLEVPRPMPRLSPSGTKQ